MKKILICGDSFAADWTVKYSGEGWPNLLAKDYSVTNLAQAGCSEYRIYRQLTSTDLSQYDCIIVFHTSPNRLYTKSHPVHHGDILHQNSDLLYSDIKEHSKDNPSLLPIIEYFEKYFDLEHAHFIHNLLCEKIENLLLPYNVIHATGIDWFGLHVFNGMLDFSKKSITNKGYANHFDLQGNKFVYETIIARLNH